MPSSPPLPLEQVEFSQTGVSLLVGACGPDLTPEGARAVGIHIWPDARHATVYLADATSTRCREALATDGRIAVTLSRVLTHQTMQLKGRVIAVRPARDDERAVIDRYIEMFTDRLAEVGMSAKITPRLTRWPATAVEFEIAEVFEQTPGPAAGNRLSATR